MRQLYYITLLLLYWCLNPSPPLGRWWLRFSCQLFWKLPSLLWQLSWSFVIIYIHYKLGFRGINIIQTVPFLWPRDLLVIGVYYLLVSTRGYKTYVECWKLFTSYELIEISLWRNRAFPVFPKWKISTGSNKYMQWNLRLVHPRTILKITSSWFINSTTNIKECGQVERIMHKK